MYLCLVLQRFFAFLKGGDQVLLHRLYQLSHRACQEEIDHRH